jgi:hypothetical protein
MSNIIDIIHLTQRRIKMVQIENRDRAMVSIDPSVSAVLRFMLREIPATDLVWVAESVGKTARFLWADKYGSPEPRCIAEIEHPSLSISCEKQPSAI